MIGGGGPFSCGPTAGVFDTGGKSQQVLQCDKFGEYSHAGPTPPTDLAVS